MYDDFFTAARRPCPLSKGSRVEITGLMNDPDPLPVGSRGTVVGGNGSQIWVRWDSGRSLMLLTADPYRVLSRKVK